MEETQCHPECTYGKMLGLYIQKVVGCVLCSKSMQQYNRVKYMSLTSPYKGKETLLSSEEHFVHFVHIVIVIKKNL